MFFECNRNLSKHFCIPSYIHDIMTGQAIRIQTDIEYVIMD